MVLPVIKLGSLVLRTISKPIANSLKRYAAYNPTFRSLIIELAQGYHRMTSTMQRHLVGRSSTWEIRPLNEEKAIQAATGLLGEFFIFSEVLYYTKFIETKEQRPRKKKEERRKQEFKAMKQRNENLAAEVKLLKQRLEQVELNVRHRTAYRFWKWREYQHPSLGNFKQHLPRDYQTHMS